MPNPLDDLTGKTIVVNGVPFPDRKRLRITSGFTAAADNPAESSTDLTINTLSGPAWERPPIPLVGQMYMDTDLGIPIWWDGSQWVDASGVPIVDALDFLGADYYWDAAQNVTTPDGALATWEDVVSNIELFSWGNPTHDSTAAALNNLPATLFDGAGDYLQALPGDWSQTNQRFFHNNTTDWEIQIPINLSALTGAVIGTQGALDTDVGFALLSTSDGRAIVQIGNNSEGGSAQTAAGTVVVGTSCIIGARYTTSTRTLEASVNGVFGSGTMLSMAVYNIDAHQINLFASGDGNLIGAGSCTEVLIMKRKLTVNERANLIDYWSEKYAI